MAANAHELLFEEHAGERAAVLLVHWTDDERDALIAALEATWEYHFVNEVRDTSIRKPPLSPAHRSDRLEQSGGPGFAAAPDADASRRR